MQPRSGTGLACSRDEEPKWDLEGFRDYPLTPCERTEAGFQTPWSGLVYVKCM